MFFSFPIQQRPKPQDDLKTSIIKLVNEFETNPENSKAITVLSTRYSIKRRRLYDVINVFASVGCCQKSSLDQIFWKGTDKILPELTRLRHEKQIDDPSKTLADLFPLNSCIGISNLTIGFLLMFYALKSNRIDIRFVAQFLSRETGRYKTTLCKLYQISYILSTIGITTRSEQVCEVLMNPPYISQNDIIEAEPPPKQTFMNIDSLLNRPVHQSQQTSQAQNHQLSSIPTEHYALKRREEIKDCFIKNVLEKEFNIDPNSYMNWILIIILLCLLLFIIFYIYFWYYIYFLNRSINYFFYYYYFI